MISLLTGKSLVPVGASKKTKEAIRQLDMRYFETMAGACDFDQMDEIDRAYDKAREDLNG